MVSVAFYFDMFAFCHAFNHGFTCSEVSMVGSLLEKCAIILAN